MKITTHERLPVGATDIEEMARIGRAGDLEIYVWTNDAGSIPHVHVTNNEPKNKATRIDACVQLEKAAYFEHGMHLGMLNASQRKELNRFMHSPHKSGKLGTNYEYAVILWNDNNSGKDVILDRDDDGNVIVPDYIDIEPYKEA